MKTIGLIGGMSWVSTLEYYRTLNEEVQRRLGGLHSARVLLHSLDFAPLAQAQKVGNWEVIAKTLTEAARTLETAGAEILLIGANTMHRVAEEVQARIGIPLIHIADAVGSAIIEARLQSVGLLGTRATMEQNFYARKLSGLGLQVLTPSSTSRERLDQLIFTELCRGSVTAAARELVRSLILELQQQGAQGVILGCTELGSVVTSPASPVPLFDSARLHALKAVDLALPSA